MQKDKALIALLRGLAELVAQEADRNPDFATGLAALLTDLPGAKPRAAKVENLPDIHAEWSARGEAAFRLWLADLPVPVLRAIIAREDLDPMRKSKSWRMAQKLATLVADGLAARRSRGSFFMGGSEGS